MATVRIALANITFPTTPDESVTLAEQAIADAGIEGADVICFPECFVPGYRLTGKRIPPPDQAFLERAWTEIAAAAARANVAVVLGTERVVDDGLRITALVINRDGTLAGFQDKVQLDPEEDATYSPGSTRQGSTRVRSPSAWRSVMKAGDIRKPSAGPSAMEHSSSSIRMFMKPNQADTGRPPSLIRQTRFMRRRSCVAPPKTPAMSRP